LSDCFASALSVVVIGSVAGVPRLEVTLKYTKPHGLLVVADE
jgi:hypothetical protein